MTNSSRSLQRGVPALLSLVVLLAAQAASARTITYSWEREGSDLKVLELYAPEGFIKCQHQDRHVGACAAVSKRGGNLAGTWKVLETKYAHDTMDLAQWHRMSLLERRAYMWVNRLYYRDLKKIPWADLAGYTWTTRFTVKPAEAVYRSMRGEHPTGEPWTIAAKSLESETSDEVDYKAVGDAELDKFMKAGREGGGSDRTWEITHDSFTATAGALDGSGGGGTLWAQVKWMNENIGDNSLHIHVVFKRSEFGLGTDVGLHEKWAKMVASIGYFLNDKAQVTSSVTTSKYLNPFNGVSYDALVALLKTQPHIIGPGASADSMTTRIEKSDSKGHRVGRWKFGNVSIRQNYGDPDTIGYEFRYTGMPYRNETITAIGAFMDGVDLSRAPADIHLVLPKRGGTQDYTLQGLLSARDFRKVCDTSGKNLGVLIRNITTIAVIANQLEGKTDPDVSSRLPWAPTGEDGEDVLLRAWCAGLQNFKSHLDPATDNFTAAVNAFSKKLNNDGKDHDAEQELTAAEDDKVLVGIMALMDGKSRGDLEGKSGWKKTRAQFLADVAKIALKPASEQAALINSLAGGYAGANAPAKGVHQKWVGFEAYYLYKGVVAYMDAAWTAYIKALGADAFRPTDL